MTAPRRTKLAYLTEPQPGVYILNLQFQDGALQRVEITKAQLGGIVSDGASMAYRASVNDAMKDWLVSRENRVPETLTESANGRASDRA